MLQKLPGGRWLKLGALILALAPFASRAGAPAISHYGVSKWEDYLQNSSATPVSAIIIGDNTGNYNFQAQVAGSSISGLTPAPTVTLPDSTVITLPYDVSGGDWGFDHGQGVPVPGSFNTKAALDAAFPNGNYTMDVGGTNVTLNLSPDSYPVTPTITNGVWDGAGNLVVNAAADYTLNFNNFTGYANDGHAALQIYSVYIDGNSQVQVNWGDNPVNLSSFFNFSDPLPSNYIIVANALSPNTTYYAELVFGEITDLDTTSIPASFGGVANYEVHTGFFIDTVPEPASAALLFGIAGVGVAWWRKQRRNAEVNS